MEESEVIGDPPAAFDIGAEIVGAQGGEEFLDAQQGQREAIRCFQFGLYRPGMLDNILYSSIKTGSKKEINPA